MIAKSALQRISRPNVLRPNIGFRALNQERPPPPPPPPIPATILDLAVLR